MKYTPEQTAALLNALAACRAETQGGGSASNACTKAIETLAQDVTGDVKKADTLTANQREAIKHAAIFMRNERGNGEQTATILYQLLEQ